MNLVASALQWTGSSTEPKSWIHVCVLISGSAEALTFLPLPKSVKVFDAEHLGNLNCALEELTERMIQLLRDFIEYEPGGCTYETIKQLSGIITGWPKDIRGSRLTLKAQTVFGDGLHLFAAEGMEDEEVDDPTLKSSRKVVPVDVVSGDVSFEGALVRLVDANDDSLTFSTEHRNYPYIFRLSAPAGGGASSLNLWFDVDKSNVPQALKFSELVEGTGASRVIVFKGASGEVARLTLG